VPGDDLATIASGPTVLAPSGPGEVAAVLEKFELAETPSGRRAIVALTRKPHAERQDAPTCRIANLVIGNNAAAVDAAGVEAERLGYSHAMTSAVAPEGPAEDVARHLVGMALAMRSDRSGPDCLISGGEPTVRLAPEVERGLGGRNQQLCLAALAELDDWRGLALLSGGTDGEDGPTDAAGACVNAEVAEIAKRLQLDAAAYLRRNDAYRFFERAGGLLKTGPTQTNVCDVRVVLISRD
jgi:glycerate-2-kinase